MPNEDEMQAADDESAQEPEQGNDPFYGLNGPEHDCH